MLTPRLFAFVNMSFITGIQDVGEIGIPGVQLRLVNDNQDKTDFVQPGVDGNADQVLTTDEDGLVSFSKVPQNKRFRVKVVKSPPGAVSTHRNRGEDAEKDSDLHSNSLSDSFTLITSGTTFSEIDLGYRMPNSMIVRVWDDSNGDGIQDEDEAGIPGVDLRLVLSNSEKSNLPSQDNDGNAGSKVTTNEAGYASFTMVPQDTRMHVKVINAPTGATVTKRNQGGDNEVDSDLQGNSISDRFTLTEAGDYTEIDLGYRMPTQMVVRVWNDANNNGKTVLCCADAPFCSILIKLTLNSFLATYNRLARR
jgi:serine-aspartate repeat-containing protein C/D/E